MSTTDLLRLHAPTAPEDLRARVLAQPPAEPRARVRPLLLLAAALALGVAAALVYGLADSRDRGSGTLVAGKKTAPDVRESAPASSAGVAGARVRHTDASLTIRVDGGIGGATSRATRIASSLGGYAQSVRYGTPEGVSYIELRVPAQNVRRALSQLASLGDLVAQQISVEDLTSKLQAQSSQIAQLRRRIGALKDALRNGTLSEADRVLLELRLVEAKGALAQRLHGRRGTIAAAATARVSVVLTTTKENVLPAKRSRLDRMLRSAVDFLALEGMVILFALIVAGPFALALALVWLRRRRAVDRLLLE